MVVLGRQPLGTGDRRPQLREHAEGLFGLGAPNEYAVNRFTGLFHEHARVLEVTLTAHPYVAGTR